MIWMNMLHLCFNDPSFPHYLHGVPPVIMNICNCRYLYHYEYIIADIFIIVIHIISLILVISPIVVKATSSSDQGFSSVHHDPDDQATLDQRHLHPDEYDYCDNLFLLDIFLKEMPKEISTSILIRIIIYIMVATMLSVSGVRVATIIREALLSK